jgi:hypothetical protein
MKRVNALKTWGMAKTDKQRAKKSANPSVDAFIIQQIIKRAIGTHP